MSHYANGVDHNGMLTFDIIIRGEVPDLGPIKSVYLAPYTEQYIQTGPGEDDLPWVECWSSTSLYC